MKLKLKSSATSATKLMDFGNWLPTYILYNLYTSIKQNLHLQVYR